jgi:hypothetical protein
MLARPIAEMSARNFVVITASLEKRQNRGQPVSLTNEHCISAAPAALDRYLAALPAMSLIPVAPLRDAESGKVRIFSTFICVVS